MIILNQRNPVELAKQLCSLDQLSGGRLTAGVGSGGGTRLYPAFGISPKRPVARFVEGLRVVRSLMLDDRINQRGELWQLEDVAMRRSLSETASADLDRLSDVPAALRRAVKLGDGWMGAGGSRNDEFFAEMVQIKEYIKEEGLEEADFTLSKRVYLSVDRDAEPGEANAGRGAWGTDGTPGVPRGSALREPPGSYASNWLQCAMQGCSTCCFTPSAIPVSNSIC